jgi:DNA polymerase-1
MTKKTDAEKKAHYDRYGWAVDESNLATLPDSAPQAAKDLVKWLTLEGRRKALVEWLKYCGDDGKIHGKYWPIGAWTHRMSHSNPNQANIAAPFQGSPKSPVEEIKARYDADMRHLWKASEGAWLVGTDAEGIQLRILAHYMKSQPYVDAICNGNKEDETDIHNMNKKALGPICRNRDNAKTFIYAFLLGASIPKVAEILNCSTKEASQAVKNFLEALPGLKKLKDWTIPNDARRGYFTGLDGRKVKCDSEHLMLTGYLQNGEAVIMKHANILWRTWAKSEGIPFKQVNLVHDEWQTEVYGTEEQAKRLGELQCKSLEQVGKDLSLFCPLAGNTKIGRSWYETH